MPELPDFEAIALKLLLAGDRDGPGTVELAEQFRQVWNARGAADVEQVELLARALRGVDIAGDAAKIVAPAIRELDR